MFTFVISLVVVGAALFFATRIAIGATPKSDKPAMPVTTSVSGRHLAQEVDVSWQPTEDVVQVTAWRRIRSAIVLAVMATILGAIAALVVVIFGAVVLSGLRSAVQ